MTKTIRSARPTRRQVVLSTAVMGAAAAVGVGAAMQSRQGPIPVAFLMDDGATMIDFAGPWEVFQDADGRFELFTVAPSTDPITASGGMRIIPRYALADAPPAKVIVIPAMGGGRQPGSTTSAKVDWLRSRHGDADVILSVCTGAFLLARTGLLDGLRATTHHDFIADFQQNFPRVNVERHRRYVDNGKIVTAGGLTSGVDAALHIVARYHGRDFAAEVADYMEYEGRGWIEGAAASG